MPTHAFARELAQAEPNALLNVPTVSLDEPTILFSLSAVTFEILLGYLFLLHLTT